MRHSSIKSGQAAAQMTHSTLISGIDRPLLYTTIVLMLFGLVSVYTASAHQALLENQNSAYYLIKQALAAIIGFIVMIGCSRLSFVTWRRIARPMSLLAIFFLLVTMFFGSTVNGSERWIPLPFGVQFQPSDFAKVAVIALMAQATSQKKLFTGTLWLNLFLVGLMILLIYQQPNLSVSMILTFMTLMMLFIGGVPITVYVLTLPPLCVLMYHKIMETPYQKRRIIGWLHPWADPQDAGYNLIQSYYAIGSGGLFGTGFGHSIQKLYYLPFQYTDFIFAVICEELGLIGALIVIGLFAVMGWRGFTIAFSCPSNFGQMLAFGITSVILMQALINLSVTVGLMPVTGVTLPLISYGGTSVVITLAMIGILLNISRYKLSSDPVEMNDMDDVSNFAPNSRQTTEIVK